MRIAIVVGLLLVFGCAVRAKGIDHQVQHGSELEKELGYKLSVHDKHDEWRSQGFDEVFPIEGAAPEYAVKFRATAAGKLEDLSGLTLTVKHLDGIVVQVPLAIRSIWNKENEVDVQFLIKKDMVNDAILTLRCERRSEAGGSYTIRLGDYVQAIKLQKKSLPNKSFTEAIAMAREFLRIEKIDVSTGVLLSSEFKEREPPLWHIAWALGDGRVDVWVSQDGSAKLNRGHSSPRILPKKSLIGGCSDC